MAEAAVVVAEDAAEDLEDRVIDQATAMTRERHLLAVRVPQREN